MIVWCECGHPLDERTTKNKAMPWEYYVDLGATSATLGKRIQACPTCKRALWCGDIHSVRPLHAMTEAHLEESPRDLSL